MHVMIDLETLDTRPTAAILEIGATEFEPFGNTFGVVFQRTISLQSCLFAGLTLSEDTIAFWRKQPKETREHVSKNSAPLENALVEFGMWINAVNPDGIWSHGAAFDIPILHHAYAAIGMECPWHYRKALDTRTAYLQAKRLGWKMAEGVVAHKGLEDALQQAESVQSAYAHVKAHLMEWR